MAGFRARVVGAMKLRAATFEEVEKDTTATMQSAIVVVVVAVVGSVASFRYLAVGPILLSITVALVGWVAGAAALLFVGVRLLPGKQTQADIGQLLRAVGFAQAPGLLNILGAVPVVGWMLRALVALWTLVALVIAVRQALDYDNTTRAVVVSLLTWAIMFLAMSAAALFGLGAAGLGSR